MSYTREEEFESLWRQSANESIPYTEDLPAPLLVLPELYDGSLAQGNASTIKTTFVFESDTKAVLSVEEIGGANGIRNQSRFLSWASSTSSDVTHRYGHGSKKMMTKWMPDYKTANWKVYTRTKDLRGAISSLKVYSSPFMGLATSVYEDADDDNTLINCGTKWEINFNPSILVSSGKNILQPKKLIESMHELICSRYSQEILNRCEFIIEIHSNGYTEKCSSNSWKSLQAMLDEQVEKKLARKSYTFSIDDKGLTYTEYELLDDTEMKKQYPLYGKRSVASSRVHISLNGRVIEPKYFYQMMGRSTNHNDFNGFIGFANFMESDTNSYTMLPTPCTTKVSFMETCKNFKYFLQNFVKWRQNGKIVQQASLTPPTIIELQNMLKPELQITCKKWKLTDKGNKATLLKRLMDSFKYKDDESNVPPETLHVQKKDLCEAPETTHLPKKDLCEALETSNTTTSPKIISDTSFVNVNQILRILNDMIIKKEPQLNDILDCMILSFTLNPNDAYIKNYILKYIPQDIKYKILVNQIYDKYPQSLIHKMKISSEILLKMNKYSAVYSLDSTPAVQNKSSAISLTSSPSNSDSFYNSITMITPSPSLTVHHTGI